MNQTKVNPYMRSVSIIGVGCTPFMYTVDQPETNGLTEGELYGYAALKAMEEGSEAVLTLKILTSVDLPSRTRVVHAVG